MPGGTTLVRMIREQVNDTDDEQFQDALIVDLINLGLRDFALTTEALRSAESITSGTYTFGSGINLSESAGDNVLLEYPLINVKAVRYNNAVLYRMTDMDYWEIEEGASGDPQYYWVLDHITPVSSSRQPALYLDADVTCSTTQALEVYYSHLPHLYTTADVSADTAMGLPERYHQIIIPYVVGKLHQIGREPGLAAQAFAEYDSLKQAIALHADAASTGAGWRN